MVNLDLLSESYQRVGMEPFESLSELDAPESEYGSELAYSRSSSPIHLSNITLQSTNTSGEEGSTVSSDLGGSSRLGTSSGEFSMPRMEYSGHTDSQFSNLTSSVRLARFPTLEGDAIEKVRPSLPERFTTMKAQDNVDFHLYGADEAVARQIFETLLAKFSDVQVASNGIRLFWNEENSLQEFQSDGSFASKKDKDSDASSRRLINLYFYGDLTTAGHEMFRKQHKDSNLPWDQVPAIPIAYDHLDVDAHRCWDIRASSDAPLAQVEYKDGSTRFVPMPIRMLYTMDLRTFLVVQKPSTLLSSFEPPELVGNASGSGHMFRRGSKAKVFEFWKTLRVTLCLLLGFWMLYSPETLTRASRELATYTGLMESGPSTVTIYAPFKFHPDAEQVSDARWIHEVIVDDHSDAAKHMRKHSFVELELQSNDARILSLASTVRSTAVTVFEKFEALANFLVKCFRGLYDMLKPRLQQIVQDVLRGTRRSQSRFELFTKDASQHLHSAWLSSKYRAQDSYDTYYPKVSKLAGAGAHNAKVFGFKLFQLAHEQQHMFRETFLGR